MTASPSYAFATPSDRARALYSVRAEGLADFLAGPGAQWAQWLTATGFEAGLGDARALPDASGAVVAGVVGLGTAQARRRGRFGIAKAVGSLPAGDWVLTGDMTLAERAEGALGWLLAGYRFDRYRPGRKPAVLPRLVCPEGVDAARLTAMAEGEALTRDLINTPAQDMGPDELEAALMALAARFGAKARAIVGDALVDQNFPMIHAVGRASPRAPRLLDLRWGTEGPALTLVARGCALTPGG